MRLTKLPLLFLCCTALLALSACSTTYYKALEKVGVEKRELLTKRLDNAREAQGDAQEAYVDALTQFRSVVNFDGGELESMYNRLSDEYDTAQSSADAFGDRIKSVENVAEALFREWETELEQYQDAGLRAQSQRHLNDTRRRFAVVDQAMLKAKRSFQPALAALKDKVLFLKHNLNAAAIGSIRTELPAMEAEAARLRRDVELANAEAERFLKSFSAK